MRGATASSRIQAGWPMINDLNDLRLFIRIVAAGSLSETARRLNCSLPAISRRLSAMEARLGARLIDRGTRHFALTEEGGLLYERGLAIIEQLDELEAQVGARASTPFGHIRVGAPNEIGRRQFAPLIADFCRLYPHVTVELVLTDEHMDVLGNEFDVGLHVDRPDDNSVVVRQILSSRRVVCASPDYIRKNGRPSTPEDLLDHECLTLVRGRHVFNSWIFEENGVRREVKVRGPLLSTSAEVLHDWALAGRGIALKALWDIHSDLQAGRLVELLPEYSCDEINLYATYPTKSHLPRRVRVFLDYMFKQISASGPHS